MKIVLYMAITVNGKIAKTNDETPWSSAIWKNYYKIAKNFKAIVLGRRTFEIMKQADEFKKIGNPFQVILTRRRVPEGSSVSSPNQAIRLLKQNKFKKALLVGGAKANASFMKESLVDEVILDVEPQIFGQGIDLFHQNDFESKLKLVNVKRFGSIVQLRYKVIKRQEKYR